MASYASPPRLRRDAATTVEVPDSTREGNWVGAPCIHRHDGERLLAVRERTPSDRGHRIVLYADHDDGRTALTELTAEALGVVSVERAALVTDPHTGDLRVYVSVDHGANDWTIQTLEPVSDPSALDPPTARTVLRPRAGATDTVTVKDPVIITVCGRYYMFYAGHDGTSEQAHLATSIDGEDWVRYQDDPVLGRQYWHDHHTRISAVLPAPDAPVWYVFYEGSGGPDYGNTWNLRTGLAVSHDLTTVHDTTPNGPLYGAHSTDGETGVEDFATLRYLAADSVAKDGGSGTTHDAYYEVARADGAFELQRAPIEFDQS